jgi:hypothetical protein
VWTLPLAVDVEKVKGLVVRRSAIRCSFLFLFLFLFLRCSFLFLLYAREVGSKLNL